MLPLHKGIVRSRSTGGPHWVLLEEAQIVREAVVHVGFFARGMISLALHQIHRTHRGAASFFPFLFFLPG